MSDRMCHGACISFKFALINNFMILSVLEAIFSRSRCAQNKFLLNIGCVKSLAGLLLLYCYNCTPISNARGHTTPNFADSKH